MSPGILVAVTIISLGQHLYLPFLLVLLMLHVPSGIIFSSPGEVFKKKKSSYVEVRVVWSPWWRSLSGGGFQDIAIYNKKINSDAHMLV